MRLLHGNYTLKRRVYVHGRVLSSGGGLLRHRSRGSFTVAGKSQRRKAGSISASPGALPPLLLSVQIQLPEQDAKRQRCLAARLIMILMVNRSSLPSREETTSDNIPNQTASTETNGTKQKDQLGLNDVTKKKANAGFVFFRLIFVLFFFSFVPSLRLA